MISIAEYAIINDLNRTLAKNADHAQAIIDRKNARLGAANREIARLRAALAAETGKRRMAELQLLRRH